MTFYVVEFQKAYEGGYAIAVCDSLDTAKAVASDHCIDTLAEWSKIDADLRAEIVGVYGLHGYAYWIRPFELNTVRDD